MHSLPRIARLFLVGVYLIGLGAVISVHTLTPLQGTTQRWELGLFVALGIVCGGKKITLLRFLKEEESGSMSVGYAITFAALMRFGPSGSVLVGTIGCLASCLYPKRQPLYQLAFNVALTAVEALVGGLVFLRLNGGTLALNTLGTFTAVLGSSLSSFAVNTGGVAAIIALCSGQNPVRLWKETFLWTAPGYLAGASISTLAIMLFAPRVGIVLLFVSPVAYLIHQSYAVYIASAEEKQQHIEALEISKAHLADLYLATIKSLALAIDAKDQYTHQHILRVQRYAVATARHMGLEGSELEGINTGALLHDIGKLGVPEYVLLKPGRLTEDEFAKVKKHPEIGAAILDPVEFPWPVLPVVKYHHEKWDGTGYPEGLKGENIPLTARILAVGDVYDALTSTRSYRNAWTHEKALEVIKKDAGTHFDPRVVEAFLQIIDGVVQEMAAEGQGPLVVQSTTIPEITSKSAQAARDIQRASSELWALYEVVQTLSTSLGLQDTLDILARKLLAILPDTTCLFLLQDENLESLTARAAVGVNHLFFEGCHTLNSASLSRTVAQSRVTYLGEYDPDDLLFKSTPSAQWTALQAALIVPIVHQGQVLGTVNLYHPQRGAFNAHDQQLLETIADRAAMALYNGLLFDRTRSDAFTDPLTGLYNVRYLTDVVEARCRATRENLNEISPCASLKPESGASPCPALLADAFALLCLDLDSFKPINDNFGHQKGDQVLRDLSQLFKSTVNEEDVVTRYGGDEFVIVLNGADALTADKMARQLQAVVEGYNPGLYHPRLGALHIGVSIGFACFPQDGMDCATLLSTADTQMYHDKTERKLGKLVERVHPADKENTAGGNCLPLAA